VYRLDIHPDFTRSTCATLPDSVQYFVNSFRDLRIKKTKFAGLCGRFRNFIYTPYLLVVPQQSMPKYELTYNCRIMTNSRLVRSRQIGQFLNWYQFGTHVGLL
jgi:predicted permease